MTHIQIGNHIFDGTQLIICFLIGEARGKGIPHPIGGRHNGGTPQCAFGRDTNQTISHFANTLFQLGLFRLPRPTAQTVKKPFFMTIAGEQFNVFNGQIQA